MKTLIFSILTLSAMGMYSQTAATTTITGSLKVNDSLNVSNNIQAADIISRGEMIAQSNLRTESDLLVNGNAQVMGNLKVNGISKLLGGVATPELILGSSESSYTKITAVSSGEGRRVYFGPVSEISSNIICIPPYNYGTSIFPDRITIPPNNSTYINNQLDFRNDGLSGFIEFGHNSSGNPPEQHMRQGTPIINTTWPTLKVNSLCNGNIEMGYGGGTVSTGKFFEVGFPDRDFKVASNIFADGIKAGQRITTLHPLNAVPGYTLYNTQLVVNTAITRALSIANNGTNAQGDEVFTVFGDGKTQINASTPSANYFLVKDVSTPSTPVDGFAVTGKGYIRMNTLATTQVNTVINVHDMTNNVDLFRVNSDGHAYAREVEIKATNMAFPDYVFNKDYKRLSLPELDAFISENKHLPGFEKAEHYETNGIKTSEMFVKQQETIENLTLYIIELEKRVKALEEAKK